MKRGFDPPHEKTIVVFSARGYFNLESALNISIWEVDPKLEEASCCLHQVSEMHMLEELPNIRQIRGEGFRRWFVDEDLELILWYDEEKKLTGFQICYDKLAGNRSVTWKRRIGRDGKPKSVLTSDGPYNKSRLYALAKRSMDNLDDGLRVFILERLRSHGRE